MKLYHCIILGGGAAGFFTAIQIAAQNPKVQIAILERGNLGLQKVKISGGGRCNVTHAEFSPEALVKNYPRGNKELLGAFYHYNPSHVIDWFASKNVPLKTEEDGRVFPVSNSSQSIIDCFLKEAEQSNISVFYKQSVNALQAQKDFWKITTTTAVFTAKKLVIATGSNTKMWQLLEQLGCTVIPPVPSLFTFICNDKRIKNGAGLVVKNAIVKVKDTTLISTGAILITHVGFSAPAILKLSAFGARLLAEKNYKFTIEINFISKTEAACISLLKEFKLAFSKKIMHNTTVFAIPKRLWKQLLLAANIEKEQRWADTNKTQLYQLTQQLTKATFTIEGKNTFKEEFVTAGGIDLKEINFSTLASKKFPNLYFAGEVLNIDAITGGFNFQNAWTTAYIAAQNIAKTTL